MSKFDLVVIGSGPGGYIAAIRAAQLGMKVACIERYSTFGGTCLNVGCIPSKAMLVSSERFEEVSHAMAVHGIEVGEVKLNLEQMLGRKSKIVDELTKGVAFLFGKNKVEGIQGHATLVSPTEISVLHEGQTQTINADKIIIATGSKPSPLRGVEMDKDRIVDSTGALSFSEVPKHLIVVGAGVIGLELGSVWLRLGAKVTVLEYGSKILGATDNEISKTAQRIFKKQGMQFILNARVNGANVKGDTVTLTYLDKDDVEYKVEGDRVLVATGRRPYTHNLGLEKVGVKTNERGMILVDEHYKTNVAGIYAIGDVIPGPMLAHKAEEEGVVCVERMQNIAGHMNYDAVPGIVYTFPEIASVGKSEEELKAAGIKFKKGKFPYAANGRAKALNATEGFVKILADATTDRILGAHIIGAQAGDLIAELAVAIEFGSASEDIARSSHGHPTLAEMVKEAALAVEKRSLNS